MAGVARFRVDMDDVDDVKPVIPGQRRPRDVVLACGPDAVLSHRDAAALHGLRRSGSRAAIHVTAPGRSKRARQGITVHNVRHLHPDNRTILDGIPVTSVHRALLDYAETGRPQELRWAFEAYDRQDAPAPRDHVGDPALGDLASARK